ncbi:MAG: sensor histidine kinase [Alphaproteobacteria bacterium]|nr:sensor histidine kinase [Alphaproteobacteria bacterium]
MKSWSSWISSALAGPKTSLRNASSDLLNGDLLSRHFAGWTLRQRLQLIVTLALLPVVMVSLFQGVARARLDIANIHDRLVQSASTVAGGDQNLLAAAEQVLRAVGSLSEVRGMSGNCDGVLSDTLIGVRYFSNLTRIDAKGNVACSAMALSKGLNVAEMDIFRQARTTSAMVVSREITSQVTGQPVIGAMLALRRPDGSFDGTVAIALDIHWIDYMIRASNLPKGAVVAVYDKSGKVIASNNPDVAEAIAHQAVKTDDRSQADSLTSSVDDSRGVSWRYGQAALIGNTIFVAFAMGEGRLFGPTYLHVGLDFLLPILMIGFAWFAIRLATDRQVNQWIAYLRRIAAAYRSGHYAIRPDLADAPAEFKQLGDAMSDMAGSIQDRDRRLREAVDMKTTLIREIHHRVKNNLQIVMSLLSIQANQVKDQAAKDALLQAQTRINALALVHRILNELEDQSTLDISQLLDELAHQIAGGMSGDAVRIEADVESREVSGNVAVAMALFTVEALTNIFKHAFPGQSEGVIRVTLVPAPGGKLKLAIADNGVGFAMDETGRSVGSRLIKTFGMQLGGVSTVRSDPGQGTVVELVFPDPDLKS